MVVMTSGMAHISGGMMAGYIQVGGANAKDLLTAVIMTAPGTLLMAKMLVPETEQPLTAGASKCRKWKRIQHSWRNRARTSDGLHLALNVGAMLITFLALLALLNAMMGVFTTGRTWPGFRKICKPSSAGFFLPSPGSSAFPGTMRRKSAIYSDAHRAQRVRGLQQLGPLKGTLDPRSFTIATFALCGFANFSSIGIQIGGIGRTAPNRRNDWRNSAFSPCSPAPWRI